MDDAQHEVPTEARSADSAARGRGEAADDALLSRLRVIEDQPLERRAEAFVHLHDELRAALEAGEAGDR
ncbi:hypothetical protein OH146_00020 [Salinibacterium sp. SYSU T00001]|uniref:hypothetical protein n=1 Tax=Homoserinimonas sedimenticola TaxID=2986805 RepID=UPI002236A2B8|nr:hypothetical protein [Salinibacterium sedimenticola]MCW4384156.1 hypothetical protein [Salinibacterium sedimenticola]